MSRENEAKAHLPQSLETFVAGEQAMALEVKEEIFSNEKIFRGFSKQPVVVLDRLNITPFLNNSPVSYKHNGVASEPDSGSIKTDLSKLSFKLCSVVLVRDDLEKLKYEISKIASNNSKYSSESKCGIIHYNCNSCSKTYKSVKRLQNHQTKKHNKVENPQPQKRVSFSDHIIVHEVQEYHRCKKCTKIFTDYKCLKKHIKQKHKKRRFYICNYCSNKFVDRIFFKNHIKLHCDSCSLLLPDKAQYLEHKRNICRSVKMYNCKTCKENYFQFMDLKDHSYEHISSCFVCDICKDQFETKCAIAHHISFLHSDKRPEVLYTVRNLGSDRLYLCNFCDESSVEKDFIESHVNVLPDLSNRAMTGYKDFYFCDQCLKKFDKETDMLQHKWSHFLKTSDNSQLREKVTIKDNSVTEKESNINENVPNTTLPVALDKIVDTTNKKSLEQGSSSKQNTSETMQINVVDQNMLIDSPLKTLLINSAPTTSPQTCNNQAVGLHIQPIDYMNPPKKAIVDPRSKKTILSRFNCEICGKYYSSNYTLARHKSTQHFSNNNLRCDICEETFVWPSLLQSHNCIRMNIPEMPFDDARPEIQFDNLQGASNGLDELNIEDDDYVVGVDFDIPAPIVELTEFDHQIITDPIPQKINDINDLKSCVQSLGYKLVMQEVPIEF